MKYALLTCLVASWVTLVSSAADASAKASSQQSGNPHQHHHGHSQPNQQRSLAVNNGGSRQSGVGISVSKEPLVQYSERGTPYTDQSAHSTQSRRVSKRVGDEYGPPQAPSFYPHPSNDPEPIIEIIIKDSNETLPAPPVYEAPTPKPTKEPVQVFYVKYKKNPNSYGKEDEIIYEPPVPALTPPTNNQELEHTPPSHTIAYTTQPPLPPRPSTTLRTIIRPDSEIYHGTGGVKVTFGKTEIHPAPVISHREDSSPSLTHPSAPHSAHPHSSHPSRDHLTKRDSQAAGSDLQPVRRTPEYRSPILNQNEFQALPPGKDFSRPFRGPPNDYHPNNAIGDFSGPFKNGPEYNRNGPQEFGNNFDGRIRNGPFEGPGKFGPKEGPVRNGPFEGPGGRGPNFNGPVRNGPPFDGPVRNGPNFDGSVRNGPNFDGPIRNGPPFDGPVRNGPNFDGPIRNGPNYEGPVRNGHNYNRPVGGDAYSPQPSGNFNRPNPTPAKVSFPGAPPQPYQRPPEIQNQGPSPVYKPNQPLQPQYQSVRQEKPFVPSQPIYSQQELFQPPPQYQQNTYAPNVETKRPQINGFQQAALKTPPMQQFNTFDAVRKPDPVYEQQFTQKPSFEQYSSGKPSYSPAKQSQEIASFDEPVYQKPSTDSKLQLQKQQLYDEQKQEIERQQQAQLQQLQQQYYSLQQQQYSKPPTQTEAIPSSFLQQSLYNKPPTNLNVEQQNNLFVQGEQTLSSLRAGTELSNEEYQLLLEKQRLAQVKLLQKDREQYQQQGQQDQQRLQEQRQQQERQQQEQLQRQQQEQQQRQQLEQQQRQQQEQLQRQQQERQQQELLQRHQQELQRQQQEEAQLQQQRLQNHRPETDPYQGKLSQYQTSKKTQDVYSKPTTTKYVSSTQPSVKYQSTAASQVTTVAPETTTELTKAQKEKFNKNLLALPDEVPDDIREQLLSSGILGNADIQILDYDKVGDIPIENLPPEALANFYGGGGAAQKRSTEITKRSADNVAASSEEAASSAQGRNVEMKVVKFNPDTPEGQQIAQSYLQGQPGQPQTAEVTLDPVVLNDASYNRYLPLKVNGASFPLPNSELLRNRRITSVVVLAPVDYESIIPDEPRAQPDSPDHVRTTESGTVQTHDHRDGKAVKVAGVHFVSGNILNELIKNPTEGNFKHWLSTEKQFPVSKQSIVLLVTNPNNATNSAVPALSGEAKEVFMYDFNTDNISELKGDLSETFLQVAESNASSEDLENVSRDESPVATSEAASHITRRSEDTTPSSEAAKLVIKRES
ncbi:hypothetical protein M8J76_009914 [Diaphorina citri]|nr:hypothetical protein M8J76_009914 [Diaphorina citri]